MGDFPLALIAARSNKSKFKDARMQGATIIVFTGQFQVESFVEFVDHRARRLQLDAVVEAAAADRIEVAVSGQRDLVDAFEMACSLGPIDCLVRDVGRKEAT
jgi:acylphosphatase